MKYTEKDFTQWHDGKTKPVHEGLYQVDYKWYSMWDGRQWLGICDKKNVAARVRFPSWTQNKEWRGLRIKPKG